MSVTLEHVSLTYRTGTQAVAAVRDVSVHIGDGEFVGVMGRTGCGKTTLLQLVAGLLAPDAGRVLVDGHARAALRRTVGVVFQHPEYQLFETSVEQDVAFGLRHSGLSKADVAARVREALELMDFSFEDVRAQSPLALSGGEKRRVAIAGVLAGRREGARSAGPCAGRTKRRPFGR